MKTYQDSRSCKCPFIKEIVPRLFLGCERESIAKVPLWSSLSLTLDGDCHGADCILKAVCLETHTLDLTEILTMLLGILP